MQQQHFSKKSFAKGCCVKQSGAWLGYLRLRMPIDMEISQKNFRGILNLRVIRYTFTAAVVAQLELPQTQHLHGNLRLLYNQLFMRE